MSVETRSGVFIPEGVQVLTFNGVDHTYKSTKDLDKNDVVCLNRKFNFPEKDMTLDFIPPEPTRFATNTKEVLLPNTCSPELSDWLGYVVANGHVYVNAIAMSSNISAKTAHYESLVKQLFGVEVNISSSKRNCKSFNIFSVTIKRFLDYLCDDFSTARFKTVPKYILSSTKESQRRFLRALFDCDASQFKSVFQFSTASETVARDVNAMLYRFGVVSFIKRKYVKNYPDHTYWSVYVYGADLDMLYSEILYDSFKYLPPEVKKRSTNVNVVYGLLERLIGDTNMIRKELDVNKAGVYMDSHGNQLRFKAANVLMKVSSMNISYDKLNEHHECLCDAPEDQKDLFYGMIKYVGDILENNYFYDIVENIECEQTLESYSLNMFDY